MKRLGEMIVARTQVEHAAARQVARAIRLAAFALIVAAVQSAAPIFERIAYATDMDAAPGLTAAASELSTAEEFQAELPRTAFWPFTSRRRVPLYESTSPNVTPHPAVARIVVPEGGVTSFGSGTLVDVRDQFGLVVTNWHVVRDSQGVVEVVFPNGFRSNARPLKVDQNWDLAALVIWRPQIEPVPIARQAPRPGDLLTIHGYGRGQYRIATGRCTAYYAPHQNYPMEMVELDAEARQGDSGGPILNDRGEIAGVLFGAGQGTTLGSFAPRVRTFLASLAPDIGQVKDQAQVAVADRPAPNVEPVNDEFRNGSVTKYPSAAWAPKGASHSHQPPTKNAESVQLASNDIASSTSAAEHPSDPWPVGPRSDWFDHTKSGLAMIGLAAIALRIVKFVR